jgi:signal transduction histidine kinase
VQEALTNTLKHAGPSCASVELHYRPDHLDVRVADDGKGFNPDAVPGHGVIGMRQRAAMLGGQLSVLPGTAGGVLVTASLPTET